MYVGENVLNAADKSPWRGEAGFVSISFISVNFRFFVWGEAFRKTLSVAGICVRPLDCFGVADGTGWSGLSTACSTTGLTDEGYSSAHFYASFLGSVSISFSFACIVNRLLTNWLIYWSSWFKARLDLLGCYSMKTSIASMPLIELISDKIIYSRSKLDTLSELSDF